LNSVHKWVKAHLKDVFHDRPALDLNGTFFTIAVKDGSSELYHLDWKDDLNTWAFVIPIGDWTGGELCIPQLGVKIPIRQGQVLGIMARLLVHCSAPITSGHRTVFTCFSNATLMKHGREWLNERGFAMF
jgi:hypothetical protein